MYVHMYVRIYTYMHDKYIHTYIHVYIHIYTYINIYAYMYIVYIRYAHILCHTRRPCVPCVRLTRQTKTYAPTQNT